MDAQGAPVRARACVAVATAAAALAVCAMLPASALALREPLPGPLPPSSCVTWPAQCLIQTRNGGFALSTHIVRAGDTLTGTVSNRCKYHNGTDPCPIDWSYMVPVGERISGCKTNDVTCAVRVAKDAPSGAYGVINVGITSDQGEGWSSDYYAVVGRDQAVVTGKILNKEHQPVPGAEIALYGGSVVDGAENYVAQSGPTASTPPTSRPAATAAGRRASRSRTAPRRRSIPSTPTSAPTLTRPRTPTSPSTSASS